MPRLGEVLVEQEIITRDQLSECLALQRKSRQCLASILLSKGYIDEETLVVMYVEQLDIPHIRLAHRDISISKDVLRLVPENLARKHQILPLSVRKTADELILAVADPMDLSAMEALRGLGSLAQYKLTPVVAFASELRDAIERFYGPVE